jgi:hypothetical protein
MATFKSDNLTAVANLRYSDKSAGADSFVTGAPLLYANLTYTLAALAANDVIELFNLPPGAEIVPQLSHVTSADPGTTLTLDIGDAGDADRYADGISLNSGGQVAFCSGTLPVAYATPFHDNKETMIRALVTAATTITAGVKLVFTIAYRIRG